MMRLQLLLKGHSSHRFVQFHQEPVMFGMTQYSLKSLIKAGGICSRLWIILAIESILHI